MNISGSARKALSLAVLVGLAATPLATQAAGIDRALDACVSAFAERYLPDRTVTVHKLIPADSPLLSMAHERQYTILLDARGKKSGDLLAQASCVASRRGDVIVLESPVNPERVAQADVRATLLR
jgi:hypothetical protein